MEDPRAAASTKGRQAVSGRFDIRTKWLNVEGTVAGTVHSEDISESVQWQSIRGLGELKGLNLTVVYVPQELA